MGLAGWNADLWYGCDLPSKPCTGLRLSHAPLECNFLCSAQEQDLPAAVSRLNGGSMMAYLMPTCITSSENGRAHGQSRLPTVLLQCSIGLEL